MNEKKYYNQREILISSFEKRAFICLKIKTCIDRKVKKSWITCLILKLCSCCQVEHAIVNRIIVFFVKIYWWFKDIYGSIHYFRTEEKPSADNIIIFTFFFFLSEPDWDLYVAKAESGNIVSFFITF